MRDILPNSVIEVLGDRLASSVVSAEEFYHMHSADEDSVTGGLGQALAMAEPISFIHESNSGSKRFSILISYEKVRGRGMNAPEKIYGIDGIIQLSVYDDSYRDFDGKLKTKKILPFQAKNGWSGTDKKLLEQVKKMYEKLGTGIVIDYSDSGYKACELEPIIVAEGSRDTLQKFGSLTSLAYLLKTRFWDCTVGKRDVDYEFSPDKFNYGHLFHRIHIKVQCQPWG